MTRFSTFIALFIGMAAPVAADDQLARSLGLEPGEYTLSEMVQFLTDDEDEDRNRVQRRVVIHKKRVAADAATRAALARIGMEIDVPVTRRTSH